MADSKITALSDGSPLVDTDELVIARSGSNYKIPGGALPAGLLGITSFINLNFTTASGTPVLITNGSTKVLTVTVTVPAGGRSVKITTQIYQLGNTTSGDYIELSIWRGTVGSGTLVTAGAHGGFSGAGIDFAPLIGVETPSAGSVTYNVGLSTAAAGGTAQAFSPNTAGKGMMVMVEGI